VAVKEIDAGFTIGMPLLQSATNCNNAGFTCSTAFHAHGQSCACAWEVWATMLWKDSSLSEHGFACQNEHNILAVVEAVAPTIPLQCVGLGPLPDSAEVHKENVAFRMLPCRRAVTNGQFQRICSSRPPSATKRTCGPTFMYVRQSRPRRDG
jgi:hypothetical protein